MFFPCSGLRINIQKSKLMGIAVDDVKVSQVAKSIGCLTFTTPFSYLGVKVGGRMSRIKSRDEIVNKLLARLSKWKMKMLSIEGRLTLLKSVLGSTPIYYMSMFKVPMQVLNKMETIRSRFFNGENDKEKKLSWSFRNDNNSLWAKVIMVVHGTSGSIGMLKRSSHASIWLDIVRDIEQLKTKGMHLISFIKKKIGNGENSLFWEEVWKGDDTFKSLYPRIYALETSKNIIVAQKLAHDNMGCLFRRNPRGGVEFQQYTCLLSNLEGVILSDIHDRWFWSLSGSGEFSVAPVRRFIDYYMLPEVSSKTKWIKVVPIKVNIHAWKVKLDCLPTRFNLSRRGVDIQSIICPCCDMAVETSKHLFFTCSMVREIYRKIATWWDIKLVEVASFEEWMAWMSNIRYHGTRKEVLEDIDVSKVLAE
ncbi:RNA-directed DNA polymerase, eukaryota, reverse transcriptase zinc-binding domain protein [Tanacetum coccineum]